MNHCVVNRPLYFAYNCVLFLKHWKIFHMLLKKQAKLNINCIIVKYEDVSLLLRFHIHKRLWGIVIYLLINRNINTVRSLSHTQRDTQCDSQIFEKHFNTVNHILVYIRFFPSYAALCGFVVTSKLKYSYINLTLLMLLSVQMYTWTVHDDLQHIKIRKCLVYHIDTEYKYRYSWSTVGLKL